LFAMSEIHPALKGWNGEALKTHDHRLPYCWVGAGGKVNWNSRGDKGSGSRVSKLICKRGSTTPTTTAEPTAAPTPSPTPAPATTPAPTEDTDDGSGDGTQHMVTGHRLAKTTAACLKNSATSSKVAGGSRSIGVRCCNAAGKAESKAGWRCTRRATYDQALRICQGSSKGYTQLCTQEQIENNAGGGTGCGLDVYPIWTSTKCGGGTAATTLAPTELPTSAPTTAPTEAPTLPTEAPTRAPTPAPPTEPTEAPTAPWPLMLSKNKCSSKCSACNGKAQRRGIVVETMAECQAKAAETGSPFFSYVVTKKGNLCWPSAQCNPKPSRARWAIYKAPA